MPRKAKSKEQVRALFANMPEKKAKEMVKGQDVSKLPEKAPKKPKKGKG